MTNAQLSVLFFIQMAVNLSASFSFGWVGKKFFNQPLVVGEMIAGILLGPTLFGLLAPELDGVDHYQHRLAARDYRASTFLDIGIDDHRNYLNGNASLRMGIRQTRT